MIDTDTEHDAPGGLWTPTQVDTLYLVGGHVIDIEAGTLQHDDVRFHAHALDGRHLNGPAASLVAFAITPKDHHHHDTA